MMSHVITTNGYIFYFFDETQNLFRKCFFKPGQKSLVPTYNRAISETVEIPL